MIQKELQLDLFHKGVNQEYPANPEGTKEDPNILRQRLKEVADKFPIVPKELTPNHYPQIKHIRAGDKQSCALETAKLIHRGKILMYGNQHGLIFPFLQHAVERGIVEMPISQVLNIDEHADIAPYTKHFTCHTASWQRYGIDYGFWKTGNSYNWQPERSTATPREDFSPDSYIRSIEADEIDGLSPDVVSIDLDFFNNISPDTDEYQEYIEKIRGLVKRSKCVFVFSSSGWTRFETLSPNTMQRIVKEIQDAFIEGE